MGRTCTICRHPAREVIDASLIRRVSYRNVAKRFGVSQSALSRHFNNDLAEHVQQALKEYGQHKGVKVLLKLSSLVERLEVFLDRAEANEDGAEFRAHAGELRKQLELISKLQGDLDVEGATTNIYLNPEWISLRTVIIQTLDPFPLAREALVAALEEESTNGHS